MMARRKISLGELAEKIDITPANLSILKTGKAKAIRFSTLEAICKYLTANRQIYWSIRKKLVNERSTKDSCLLDFRHG